MPETINPDVENLTRRHVDGRAFRSANDVLLAAMRLFDQYQEHQQLRRDVQAGFDDIRSGNVAELADDAALRSFFDDVKTRGRQRLAAKSSV